MRKNIWWFHTWIGNIFRHFRLIMKPILLMSIWQHSMSIYLLKTPIYPLLFLCFMVIIMMIIIQIRIYVNFHAGRIDAAICGIFVVMWACVIILLLLLMMCINSLCANRRMWLTVIIVVVCSGRSRITTVVCIDSLLWGCKWFNMKLWILWRICSC